ncbi:inactive protein RESTRICTED TEV MOVEMENT 2-like [Panicum virgatum]|uniref:SHSP domain-containing protein n=1 Tax=Panicum virgatum TaxID=38727 RepID=A0A8T0UIU7_PANVG|nr:inactive protein RESTRICTED TEV MOVEMENT 2-like [Panicum virgatum]KAG2622287.1 hypothetical protein PVAP13_3NG271900 [Panicum virgatum]
MDRRRGAAREYEDFDPVVEWKLPGEDQDVVEISLPGFRKDQVRVQVDNHGVLRATGERPARGGRWARFKKDLRLPDNCDANGVRARFEGEKLIITLPIVAAAGAVASPTPSPPETETSPLPLGTAAAGPGQMEPALQERKIAVSPPSPAPLPWLPIRHEEEAWKKQLQDATSPAALPPRLPEEKNKSKKQKGTGGPSGKSQAQAVGDAPVPPPEPTRQLLVNAVAAAVVLVGIIWWAWRNATSAAERPIESCPFEMDRNF